MSNYRFLLPKDILDEASNLYQLGVPLTKIANKYNIPKKQYQTFRRLVKFYTEKIEIHNILPVWLDTQEKNGIFYVCKEYKFTGVFPHGYWERVDNEPKLTEYIYKETQNLIDSEDKELTKNDNSLIDESSNDNDDNDDESYDEYL